MKLVIVGLSVLLSGAFVTQALAEIQQGVLLRCGASKGTAYFFKDDLTNPGGPEWSDDGISEGKISLVRLGDEWDIQFGDALGAYGYREDGASVVPLGTSDKMITIGAFRGTYADVYTFNLADGEVLWSSHKIGSAVPKVGMYRAKCK
ncbi:hypothetical protein [Leisingera daeponensis]|uniref:hypothetical protein n=1 Tax=Leisingera daeponensis TaxID=405746 RepID=UPI001C94B7C9|nr:hypothetical protein [Leisingera daeponensis]MBY6056781.1 hypothetical protein [Leisingera daeponensis]